MKRILHISKYYYPFRGGTEQIARDCVNALSELYEQKVICFNHEGGDRIDVVDGCEIIRCGCFAKILSQSLSMSYGKILKKTILDFKPDMIIFHYPNPFVTHFLLKYIPKDIKLITYWHLDIVKQKILGTLFYKQNVDLIKKSDLLIATSPNYVEGSPWLSKCKGKCVVIPNCIDENRLQPTEESKKLEDILRNKYQNKTICVSVGRLTKYKGYKYLIEASKLLDESFEIIIIGKGEEFDELKAVAKGDFKVHFLGCVSDDELKAYLSVMDIFCFPSVTRNEAFGVALAESMYYGKPAVTFTIPGSGVNYVGIDGETCIEVPNRDVEKYAEAIKVLKDDALLRKKYGNAAKDRVLNNFLNSQFREHIVNAIGDIDN